MTIYALIDPRNGKIRYIGKSISPPERLKAHIKDAKQGERNHRCNWLRKLLSLNLRPTIIEIETCDGDGVAEEIYHIALARADGIALTNSTGGGEGMFEPTPELRERMRVARTGIYHSEESKKLISGISKAVWAGRTDEQRKAFGAKISKSKIGSVMSEESRRKMSEAKKGKPLKFSPEGLLRVQEARKWPRSDAYKQKIREIMTGRILTPEWRQKISAAKKGKSHPNSRSGLRGARKFTDEVEAAICAEYQAGGITKQIAAAHGVTHYLITSILRRHSIPPRPHSLLPHQIERMRASKTGKKQSPELIAKRTAGSKGRPKSAEAIQRMRAAQSSDDARKHKSEAAKQMWAKRRELSIVSS